MKYIKGYLRKNGKVGVRNHVVIFSTVICANSVAKEIENMTEETISVTHPYGCSLDPENNKEMETILTGIGCNPNVAGVLLVSLGCETVDTSQIINKISKENKPVEKIIIQKNGGTKNSIKNGVKIIKEIIQESNKEKRENIPLNKITIGLECGASDSYSGLTANPVLGKVSNEHIDNGGPVILSEITEFIGAEEILANRCINEEVKENLLNKIKNTEDKLTLIGESNIGDVTPGNSDGGLTTIEEKSLGCIKKGGDKEIKEVVGYGIPPKKKGLVVMDTPGHDVQSMVGMVAGGAQLIIFSTGRGTPTGSPIAPVIKVSSNTEVYKNMFDNIDVDAGKIISENISIDDVKEMINEKIIEVTSGKKTKSEINKNREFAIRNIGSNCIIY